MAQITNHIMMVRPANFGFNDQTATNNSFQSSESRKSDTDIQSMAVKEFDNMVDTLRGHGVTVTVIKDTEKPVKPDAIFPNNWISLHANGAVITYPMYAPNRRVERREDIVDTLGEVYDVKRRYSIEQYEAEDIYLEGTGSMIFDREHKIVYASVSKRTDPTLIDKFCVLVDYNRVVFHSVDRKGVPIYHTNVMMAIANDFVVICMDSIPDEDEQKLLKKRFKETGKEIIEISQKQVEHFAGNMLQVAGTDGKPILVMSQAAYDALNTRQIATIEKYSEIAAIPIPTIEYFGGGSVRCMMAEVFLPELPMT